MGSLESAVKNSAAEGAVEMTEKDKVIDPGRMFPDRQSEVANGAGASGGSSRGENGPEMDESCCGRATFCHPVLREMAVDKAISTCLGQKMTWATLFWLATSVGLVGMSWVILFLMLGDPMLPGGNIFGLFFVIVSSYSLGWLLTHVPYLQLPPVFGMLLSGIIVRNSGLYDISEQIGYSTLSKIRNFCLTFIIVRAGLQTTTTSIRDNRLAILLLSIVPCSLEMLAVALVARFFLLMDWTWAFLAGTIVASLSPVVTVNCVLALAEEGYGEDKGIASLLCTAASIDTVFIVWLFSVCYTVVFADDEHRTEWWSKIPGGLRDFILGIIVGVAMGFFLAFFPHRNHKHVVWYRTAALFLASVMCNGAASRLAITGGGFLAIFLMSFIAITGWKILTLDYNTIPLQKAASYAWHFMQPVLVGVIGADIDFSHWSLESFGMYVFCIISGLVVRGVSAFFTVFKTDMTRKEKLFVALSWLPKGTMQAALAPMSFERSTKNGIAQNINFATDIVRMSVVSVVFMAPLGSIIMMCTGPLLLKKISPEERNRDRELSYLKIISLQPVRTRKHPNIRMKSFTLSSLKRKSNNSENV
ncbi:sodium/hydrogen exchanger 9B2-like [Prorops nasuta]|uniref:sodium/hydrogen exchanger 9B2-like n=1 Tax=Prorops nasuta TaxID=863751 RepID=UPI0034CEF8DE